MKLRKAVLWTVFGVVIGAAVVSTSSRVQAQQKPEAVTQAKPNFSGTWVGISPAHAVGHQEQIRHTATTLSFVNLSDGKIISYELDGKERLSESTDANGEKMTTSSTYSWLGDKVVIAKVTSSPVQRTVESKQIFYLDSTGRLVTEFSQVEDNFRSQSMTMVSTKKAPQ